MRRVRAQKARTLLSAIASTLVSKGATTTEIVAIALSDHKEALESEMADLQEIALKKLAGEVLRRRGSGSAPEQTEMFGHFGLPKTIPLLIISDSGRSRIYKAAETVTIGEVKQCLELLTPRRGPSATAKKLARLLEELEPHAESDNSTIGACWKTLKLEAS